MLALGVGCDDPSAPEGEVQGQVASLSGRVFGSTDGKPLKDADISVAETRTKSAADGRFELSYAVDDSAKKSVRAKSADYVPVTKAAPDGDGYLELFAKGVDAKQVIDPMVGGELKAKAGASVKVDANSLKDRSGKSPKSATLSVAVPDVAKSQDLNSLPGAFDATRGGKKGKISAESPVYVEANDESGNELVLVSGKKVKISLPGSEKKASERTLYFFDEVLGAWAEIGSVPASMDADGREVYSAEVDGFGWYSLGSFIEDLSCLRACVVRADQTPVPFAQVVATGLSLSLQSQGFAGSNGCVVLEVPANVQLSLSAQTKGSYGFAGLVNSPAGSNVADPSSCLSLPAIVLSKAANGASVCSQGFAECGASCVEVEADELHCGSCGNVCGSNELCLGGVCTDPTPMVEPMADAGVMMPNTMDSGSAEPDAATPTTPDAAPQEPDAGTGEPEPVCVSDPGCESAVGGCFVRVPGNFELGTTDFCISRFEMKEEQGLPTSRPAGLPWQLANAATVAGACANLGSEFALPSNAQWQTLARNIENVAANWSGGAVGAGDLVRGNVDNSPGVALSVSNPNDPCDQSNAPSCTVAGATFSQRRTHRLSSGSEIWDVGGNVIEWVQPVTMANFFAGHTADMGAAVQELRGALGPSGAYTLGASAMVSSSYPSYAIVEAGSLAVVEGQNFSMGRIWVRDGGMLFIRGSNFQGDIYLEAGAMFANNGSNIYANTTSTPPYGEVRYSAASLVTGSLGTNNPLVAEGSYVECGGTCPATIQRFTQDGSRGFGWALTWQNAKVEWRGGRFGTGPLSGVFTGFSSSGLGGSAGFRCAYNADP